MGVSPDQSVPSKTLHVGDRTLIVEATPLAKSAQNRLGVVVGQPRPNLLRLQQPMLRPLPWPVVLAAIVIAVPFTFVAFVVFINLEPRLYRTLLGIVICVAFFGILATILGRQPQARFTAQQLRVRKSTLSRDHLIPGHVTAVQLILGRADEDLQAEHPGIQINLILDNPTQPRVGFITFRDAEWTRLAARKLADYLGVPLVDQIPDDG